MKFQFCFLFLCFTFISIPMGASQKNQTSKPRTIITTDGEIDDVDSFIRMLLYSNEFRIEGLVYSSSMWHYKGDDKGTVFVSEMDMTKKMYGQKTSLRWPGTHWMEELIDAYKKVYPLLSTHATGFPSAEYLRSQIKVGNIDFEGEMEYDTEGSDFIKSKLLDKDVSPLYIQVWGGTNTIARALKSIEDQYKSTVQWDAINKRVGDKLILYTILDQDATYKKYIAIHWPNIKVYYNAHQFGCLAYPWKRLVPKELQSYLEGTFMSEQILHNHGALTELYYSYGDSKHQAGDDEHIHGDSSKMTTGQWGSFNQYDFISEGDSPAFLHLIDVGLDNINHPEYGGWGGRLKQSAQQNNRWEDGAVVVDINPFTNKPDQAYPQTRWLDVLQLDFAARADWCVKDFKHANHPPRIIVKQNVLSVQKGKSIQLNAEAKDPDGNKVEFKFWQYLEAGTSKETVKINSTVNGKATIEIPATASTGDSIHIIVEGKDTGSPSLTRYQRVILLINK